MSINVDWQNPYAEREGRWLKGNLHTHTSPASGCGQVPTERVLDLYVQAGYDFIALSDHMIFNEATDNRITIIPGVEWNSEAGEHTGVYSMDIDNVRAAIDIHDHDELLASLSDTQALVILNHPNWILVPHYRREALAAKSHFDGIEIYNGVIERLDGYAISTDKWDYLLANDRRVLGFASDDSHAESDIGLAAINVRAREATPQSILNAMKSGNFYCSSGTVIEDIRKDGDIITVESADAQEIQVIGWGGRLLHRVHDNSISYNAGEADSSYIRFAVYGRGSSMAWTQSFFT